MFKFKKILAAAVCATMAISSCPTVFLADAADATVENSGLDYDYARALQYSIYFYDANMCGTEVEKLPYLRFESSHAARKIRRRLSERH